MSLPDVTQEPIKFVDMTPDADLPLRILRVYRLNCDCRWVSIPEGNLLVEKMNEIADKRATILDEAIAKLLGSSPESEIIHNGKASNPN